jgi:hypothetical protein
LALWIAFLFARALERYKKSAAVDLDRVRQRDAAIASAWHAVRKLELDLLPIHRHFDRQPYGNVRAVPGDLVRTITSASETYVNAFFKESARLPKNIHDAVQELGNALMNAVEVSRQGDETKLQQAKGRIAKAHSEAREMISKYMHVAD